MADPTQLRVLRAMTTGMDTVAGLRVSLNADEVDVREALAELTAAGLVGHTGSDPDVGFVLTESGNELGGKDGRVDVSRGRFGSTSLSFVHFRVGGGQAEPTWTDVGNMVAQAWTVASTARSADARRRDDALLISDDERETALSGLSTAFGDGRMPHEELSRRTDLVLQARTRGDLDAVFSDLPDAPDSGREGASSGTRKVVLSVVALLSVPILLMALLMATAEHADIGGRAFGVTLLVVLTSGLLAMAWWAFGGHQPRRGHAPWRP